MIKKYRQEQDIKNFNEKMREEQKFVNLVKKIKSVAFIIWIILILYYWYIYC